CSPFCFDGFFESTVAASCCKEFSRLCSCLPTSRLSSASLPTLCRIMAEKTSRERMVFPYHFRPWVAIPLSRYTRITRFCGRARYTFRQQKKTTLLVNPGRLKPTSACQSGRDPCPFAQNDCDLCPQVQHTH